MRGLLYGIIVRQTFQVLLTLQRCLVGTKQQATRASAIATLIGERTIQ